MSITTGVIGLGAMGGAMALNLHRAGLLTAVWNRTASKAEGLAAETGVAAASDPADLAGRCEVVITCVSADRDLLDVVDARVSGIKPGAVVVDTSTVGVDTAQTAAARLEVVGAGFLDAPVSGGVEGARKGTLSVMVGGEGEALARVRPVLEAIAERIVHMGAVGAGQATKAVNQIMVAGIAQGVTDALAFGQALGLDMDKVIEVVSKGAAGNWFLEHRGPTMIRDQFGVGFKLRLHHKDLSLCRAMAQGASLDSIELTLAMYERLIAEGHGDEDISALFRLKRRLFDNTD